MSSRSIPLGSKLVGHRPRANFVGSGVIGAVVLTETLSLSGSGSARGHENLSGDLIVCPSSGIHSETLARGAWTSKE